MHWSSSPRFVTLAAAEETVVASSSVAVTLSYTRLSLEERRARGGAECQREAAASEARQMIAHQTLDYWFMFYLALKGIKNLNVDS
jgi:hypothetical protein